MLGLLLQGEDGPGGDEAERLGAVDAVCCSLLDEQSRDVLLDPILVCDDEMVNLIFGLLRCQPEPLREAYLAKVNNCESYPLQAVKVGVIFFVNLGICGYHLRLLGPSQDDELLRKPLFGSLGSLGPLFHEGRRTELGRILAFLLCSLRLDGGSAC